MLSSFEQCYQETWPKDTFVVTDNLWVHVLYMCKVKAKVIQSCNSLQPHGLLQARTLDWVASPFSRGIFPTQGPNPGLLHGRQILYQLSDKESPIMYAILSKMLWRTSLVVQWLTIHLPMLGTWVQSLVQEDLTCHRATKTDPVLALLQA